MGDMVGGVPISHKLICRSSKGEPIALYRRSCMANTHTLLSGAHAREATAHAEFLLQRGGEDRGGQEGTPPPVRALSF